MITSWPPHPTQTGVCGLLPMRIRTNRTSAAPSVITRLTQHAMPVSLFVFQPGNGLTWIEPAEVTDLHDHYTRVANLCGRNRKPIDNALEAYLTTTSNWVDDIMKVLTAMSTITLPLTFIAGVLRDEFRLNP